MRYISGRVLILLALAMNPAMAEDRLGSRISKISAPFNTFFEYTQFIAPNPLDALNPNFTAPSRQQLRSAISSYESFRMQSLPLEPEMMKRVYDRAQQLARIKDNVERVQFGQENLRPGGNWDVKRLPGQSATSEGRLSGETEGNLTFAIASRRAFRAADNQFLNLELASRFSGAFAVYQTEAYFADMNVKQFFEALNTNQFRQRIRHLAQIRNPSFNILNKPFGESSFDDILTIELGQDFDRFLDTELGIQFWDEFSRPVDSETYEKAQNSSFTPAD